MLLRLVLTCQSIYGFRDVNFDSDLRVLLVLIRVGTGNVDNSLAVPLLGCDCCIDYLSLTIGDICLAFFME